MVSGGGVEQVKFFVIARVSHTHPHFIELLPFDPLPSQMMGTSKLEEVEDTEAAKGVGTTNYILVDLAFGTGGFVRPGLEESPFNLVDATKDTRRRDERCNVVDCLGG